MCFSGVLQSFEKFGRDSAGVFLTDVETIVAFSSCFFSEISSRVPF